MIYMDSEVFVHFDLVSVGAEMKLPEYRETFLKIGGDVILNMNGGCSSYPYTFVSEGCVVKIDHSVYRKMIKDNNYVQVFWYELPIFTPFTHKRNVYVKIAENKAVETGVGNGFRVWAFGSQYGCLISERKAEKLGLEDIDKEEYNISADKTLSDEVREEC